MRKNLVIALVVGLVIGFSLSSNGREVVAQFTSPPDSHGIQYLANHHQDVRFTLQPGETRPIVLPRTDTVIKFSIVAIANSFRDFRSGDILVDPATGDLVKDGIGPAGLDSTNVSLLSDNTHFSVQNLGTNTARIILSFWY